MAVRIAPTYDFDGYPDGLNKRSFRVGVSVDVPEHYARLLVDKGAAVYAGGRVSADMESIPILAPRKPLRVKKSPDNE